jgi:hypothetical protein
MSAVFWGVAPGRSCENRRFGDRCRLPLHGTRDPRARSSITVDYLYPEDGASETSVLRRLVRPHIPEEDILHSCRREFIESYNVN